jgi:2',3'-cyclic-nucleotide 2'-phosphodiesterase (5'-nucleotidase family)
VAQQRQAADYVLLLDAGDALIGDGVLAEATRGEANVAGMNLMGYEALALGPKELSLGPEILQQRMAQAEFPMLSANVVLSGTEQLLAPPFTVLDVAGRRVGIIGLTRLPDKPQAGFDVLDPGQALARYVPQVTEQADTVVLLTNAGYRAVLDLVAAVPGIDLAITGLPDQLPRAAVRAPGTGTIVVTAEQAVALHAGRRVGKVVVTLNGDGSLSGESWESVPLEKQFADDPLMAALLAGYQR